MTQTITNPASETAPTCSICPRVCARKMPVASPQAHCTSCHETFSTVKNFDLHRPGKIRANGTAACNYPGALTRQKRNGDVVPLFRLTQTVNGQLWVSYTEDTRDHDNEESS